MGRTTLNIDEPVLRELKRRAAEQGRTMQAVANDALRQGLKRRPDRPYRLNWTGWNGKLTPGIDIADRKSLFDWLDQNPE